LGQRRQQFIYRRNFAVPFSITYLIGIVLGLVVLIVEFKPITMTVAAGVLMILGVAGAGMATELLINPQFQARAEAGMGLALLLSIVYTVLGAYLGRKLVVKKPTSSTA